MKKLVVQGTLCRVKPSMQNRLVKELCVCDHVVCVCVKRVAHARVCVCVRHLHRCKTSITMFILAGEPS